METLKDSSLLSLSAFALSYPYLYHYLIHRPDYLSPFNRFVDRLDSSLDLRFTFLQLFIYLFLLFICSFVGFGFSQRYKLAGFGHIDNLRKDLKYIVVAAIPVSLAMFFFLDRYIMKMIPTLYPAEAHWGLAKALMSSVSFEIVSKFGLVTVACGIFRNRHFGVIAPAIFFTLLVPKTFTDYGVPFNLDYMGIMAVATTFLYGIGSGYLYMKRGLLSVLALRFLIDLKYFVWPLISP